MCVNYKTAIHTSFQLILKQNPRKSSRNASSLTVIDICFSVQYLCISWHNSITVNEFVYILTRFAFVNVYLQMIYQYLTFIITCIFFFFYFFFFFFFFFFLSFLFFLFFFLFCIIFIIFIIIIIKLFLVSISSCLYELNSGTPWFIRNVSILVYLIFVPAYKWLGP